MAHLGLVGPRWAPWTLLSGTPFHIISLDQCLHHPVWRPPLRDSHDTFSFSSSFLIFIYLYLYRFLYHILSGTYIMHAPVPTAGFSIDMIERICNAKCRMDFEGIVSSGKYRRWVIHLLSHSALHILWIWSCHLCSWVAARVVKIHSHRSLWDYLDLYLVEITSTVSEIPWRLLLHICIIHRLHDQQISTMMTSSNGNILRVTGPLCGEFTGHRWIPRTKASDAELWCSLWSAPE